MRWCAALAVVLVALVVMTVKTIGRPHKRAAPVVSDVAEIAPPAPEPAEIAPPAPPPPQRASSGIGHLRGRVLWPAAHDRAAGLSDLEVTADDGRRTFAAGTLNGGGFVFHMPPGRYTLTATTGDLVGELRGVFVAADAEREVELVLAPGAKIGGRLRAPTDADVDVVARPAGSEWPESKGGATPDAFQIGGLILGRRYDIEFTGDRVRALKLSGVMAPAEELDVTLEARAVVRVAVGFPVGERCPIDSVKLIGGQGENGAEESVTTGNPLDCRFELPAPVDTGTFMVVAQGSGWLLQDGVTIPAHGDPAPLCLNPPCRENPLEGFARLRLALEGADADSSISVTIVPVRDRDGSSHGCGSTDSRCDIEGLRPGDTFSIRATGDDCRVDPVTVTVVAGDNHVRLPCPRQRRIEGVVRIPELSTERVAVRCAGGDFHLLKNTRLFSLTCNAAVTALEYKIGAQGSWRSIPIASLTNPAFVDIGSY